MRRVTTVTIDADGRDKGKTFRLTEMPASRAEAWAVRAFLALARSGADIPEDIAGAGFAGIAAFGLQGLAGLRYEDAAPLMAEMMECVQLIPDPARPGVVRDLIEDDVEDVATRFRLRSEVIELHTGFSLAAAASRDPAAPTSVG